jgi:SAM-dependent methyltransferase
MGLAFSFLPFFDELHQRRALVSPLLALGSQEIHEPQERILHFADKHGYTALAADGSARSLFLDRYQVEEYVDCDVNEKADLNLDLCQPLLRTLRGRFGTVMNGGTLEHVFDLAQAFANVHELVRSGGTIIHIAPLTWHDHGLVNFTPRFFHLLAKANNYEWLAAGYHFPNVPEGQGNLGTRPLIFTFLDSSLEECRYRVNRAFDGKGIPSRVLYFIAYRKSQSLPFVKPYDIDA